MLQVARARVVEPGDTRIPNPPSVEALLSARVADRINTAFDARGERLLVLEAQSQQLLEMSEGQARNRIDTRSFGLRDPRGVTVDPGTGRLFVLDGGSRIVELEPDASGRFERPAISVLDIESPGLAGARGIAFDPTTGHLHVMDAAAQRIHEISQAGEVVAIWDVSEFRLTDPQALTFAPTGDATDDPDAMGLYVAAGGQLTEFSLIEIAAAPTPVTGTLVGTTLTSQFSKPSPDPSGLAYATHLGTLIIADGEVDEMPIYAGANIFETSTSGTLVRSWTTTPGFSKEPVGAAYNPANRHLFLSDDDKTQVNEINPGADGLYGTGDDQVTIFDTAVFGCTDPEGLAFDSVNGVLFIADGENAQVWRVSPGSNGIFDGVAPAGDDQVLTFDTQALGLLDPEGIAYDSDFGHLYVVGKPQNLVFHLSTTGTVIRTIDISAAQPDKPAGLDYAPSSASASARNLYLVTRGVDNNVDPTENDGKLFEFSLPPFSGNAPPTVTITAPANGSAFIRGQSVTFTGTASDPEDGNLTAGLSWTSSIDGPLGTGGSISTSSLSLGMHTITAGVTDAGGATSSAGVTVRIDPPGLVQVRVAAGTDDAEERANGNMDVGGSDLEIVFDAGGNQKVGMRFNGVTIPRGATVTRAYVQFRVDEVNSIATSLTIRAQAADNATGFISTVGNISARPLTAAGVPWTPPGWTVVGQQGIDQQTPNIAPVVQEIVSRPGWNPGNSLVLIITGTGERVAESYNGMPAGAPLLYVEYSTGPNTVPVASNVTISGTPQAGQTLTGNYTYSDAQGDLEGTSTYRWLRDGAPIGVTTRTYTVVPADQGTMLAFEVTPVAATGASPGAAVQSAAVAVTAPPVVSATLSTVTANPTSMPQWTGASTVTVTVKDESGAPMSGVTVVVSASGDGNSLTQPAGPTNASGVATATLSSTVAGTKVVSATANGTAITQTASVEVTPADPPPPPNTQPMTHTLLTSGANGVNQRIYTTASIAPAPNALVLVAVMGHRSYGASPSPIITGGGMTTWEEVATVTFDPVGTPLKRMTIYRAMSASPGSGPITITFAASQSNAEWIVSQYEGAEDTGANGVGAIAQSGAASADAVNGLALTLLPFGDENNAAFGVFGVRSSVPAVTPGAAFTEIAEIGSAESPPGSLQAERATNVNTIDATWTNLAGAVLGIEIKAKSQ